MIVLKNIQMTLDPESIEHAIKEIELFESQLKPAMQCLIDYLGEKGVEVARAQLLYVGGWDFVAKSGRVHTFESPAYGSGALSESIRYGKTDDGECAVIAGEGLHNAMGDPDSPSYAMYVEYGNMSRRRVQKGGRVGWWYPAPYGYRLWNGKWYAFTEGMHPRPFMGNTLNELEEEARLSGARVIAEYIRGERA